MKNQSFEIILQENLNVEELFEIKGGNACEDGGPIIVNCTVAGSGVITKPGN